MSTRTVVAALAALAAAVLPQLPQLAAAQASPAGSASPVSGAFRESTREFAKNLTAAAETMPADKYGFKPTPAQMSFGDVVVHLTQGNDYLCGAIGGKQAPQRAKVAATDAKDALVARLKETFAFCEDALASLDDTKLAEAIPFFGGKTMTRAAIMNLTTGDFADHYSQVAIYMRLNGELPPTAKKP
jgi:uncharacterized damage-inducible protein DinB